ncbi:hypothetical protein LCGC14_2112050 [marine sediment metagenome]|uniref:Uncharacterized protein n=1 Tax=marine sediment metagenome TaxID=412755 RepID=A0A0F9ETV9_9ZZZZ
MACEHCGDTGEVLDLTVRLIGYTLADGEDIDEKLVPCPVCRETQDNEI